MESAPWWPVFVVLGILWLLAVRQIRYEWTINPQYTFGWTVPFLVAYLVAERWKRRPPAQAVGSRRGLAIIVIALTFLLFPVRLMQESAPDWRLLGWVMGGICVSITLAAVYVAGGRGWLRHFAFAFAFFLVAVPWPVPVEQRSCNCSCARSRRSASRRSVGPAFPRSERQRDPDQPHGESRHRGGVQRRPLAADHADDRALHGRTPAVPHPRRLVLLVGGLFVAFVCNASRAFFLVW